MNTNEKITRAEDIARKLAGVNRNEFKKWVEYLKVHGDISRAMKLAKLLSQSPMLTPSLQKSYLLISSLKIDDLMKAPLDESIEVLGYASRILERMPSRRGDVLEGRRMSGNEIRRTWSHASRAVFEI